MPQLPSIKTLWENHPIYEGFKAMVGGEVERTLPSLGGETCASQISWALNHSGAPVEAFEQYRNPMLAEGKPRALRGADKMWYIYSVVDMTVYLDGKYGSAKLVQGSAAQMRKAVTGQKGIIAFGWAHIDLWDVKDAHYIPWFDGESSHKRGVRLWPTDR